MSQGIQIGICNDGLFRISDVKWIQVGPRFKKLRGRRFCTRAVSKTVPYVATLILAFISQAPAVLADKDPWPYWDIRQFRQLTALAAELQHPRLLSTPNAGSQDLWEKGQMRVHQGSWD